jgi:hypothetical protein
VAYVIQRHQQSQVTGLEAGPDIGVELGHDCLRQGKTILPKGYEDRLTIHWIVIARRAMIEDAAGRTHALEFTGQPGATTGARLLMSTEIAKWRSVIERALK